MGNPHAHCGPQDGATEGPSRRDFLTASAAGLGAGVLAAGLTGTAQAQEAGPQPGTPGRRILLKGGVVLTMDPDLGDFEQADVLIDGARIAEVGRTSRRRLTSSMPRA